MAEDTPASKLLPILGEEGLARLEAARILVLGVGGVGSNCAEALARARVGTIALVDADVVSLSNINRQAIAFLSTQGKAKVDVMASMIHDINPDANVMCYQIRLSSENTAASLAQIFADLGSTPHMVVDAIDTISVKLTLAELAQTHGFQLISSMGGAHKLYPECLRIADIHETKNCRLSRIMRKECRKRGIRHLQVLYSCEQAKPATAVPGTERRERSGMGTVSYMPPIMGQMIAGHVIRQVTGVGSGEAPLEPPFLRVPFPPASLDIDVTPQVDEASTPAFVHTADHITKTIQ
ncbi:tRNA threonylcarbamoyladenosine dehydratase [Collinsella sp. zg1085]|uniref:tRNA threonylcarbamoyladenosine dehydratase n=1 Tax=Collinsella sp. zg1085 TaxID=2844380 RepID=UPI001C0AD211|nr:tRNA threonylcarbamoyladenosine dehydratase [Collinsella sp. zg1085]QWT18019.1 tRNA threonylcarbamoyladenosine dehydratase [Collinsella sp. zg1085]